MSEPTDAAWLSNGERGAMWGIRLVFRMARFFGRGPTRVFVAFIAFWYAIFDRPARDGVSAWYAHVDGDRPGFWKHYGHIRRFVNVTLDRIFLLSGATSGLEVSRTGPEHLQALAQAKQGAVLLGAHVGSFEAMRAGGDEDELSINIVGHFENARMINALFTDLNPDMAARVIHVGDDPMGLAITLRERVAAGEMVAILGDRTGLNAKTVTVDFMGEPAEFPAGPFLLASLLRCPVLLVFGLYFEPNRYALYCEPFADQLSFPRGDRAGALQREVQRYAERLEHYARLAPDNWFNFYDFWASARGARESGADAPASERPGRA